MSDNKTTVVVSADASGYTAALEGATRSAQAFQQTQQQAADRVRVAQQAIAEAAQNGSNASARAINNFVSQLQRTADQAGKTRAELLQMRAAQLGIADSVSGYVSQLQDASSATHEFSLNSSSARRELLVLAHEASQGNWTRFTGSIGVLAERTDALGFIMSSAGLGIGLFAAAAIAASVDIYKTIEAISGLNTASQATNGYLGLTSDQLATMADKLAVASGGITNASATMQALIRTGAASKDNIEELTQVTVQFGKDAQLNSEKAAEAMAKFISDPSKGIDELQSKFHMFSAAQIEVIDGYVKTGDTAKAAQALIDAMAQSQSRMAQQGIQEVGLLSKVWQSFVDAATQAGHNFDQMGMAATNADKMAAALERQSSAQRTLAQAKAMPFGNTGSAQAELDAANAQVAAIQKVQAAQQQQADANAARAKSGDAKTAVDAYMNSSKYATPQRQHSQALDEENASFAKATANLDKNSADYQDELKRHYEDIAQINEQYAKKTRVKTNESGINTELASLRGNNELIEQEEKRHQTALKAQHSSGLLSTEDYLSQLHDIQANAVNQEIANAQQSVDVAAAKKNQVAEQNALTDYKKLVQERIAVEDQYTEALANAQQKRATDVARYSAANANTVRTQGAGYSNQTATQGMSPQAKNEYDQKYALAQEYVQKMQALYVQYAMDPASDQKAYALKVQDQYETYQTEIKQLDEKLSQEQSVRDSYSDQMHLAVTKLGGDAQTNAQLAATAFTTAWQDSSNALAEFVTTG